jgi:hypothetical protein
MIVFFMAILGVTAGPAAASSDCAHNLVVAPVPHQDPLLSFMGKAGMAAMATASDDVNFQRTYLTLQNAKLLIKDHWEEAEDMGPEETRETREVWTANNKMILQREVHEIEKIFNIDSRHQAPSKAAQYRLDFSQLANLSPKYMSYFENHHWFWREFDDYLLQHRMSAGAVLRLGHPSLALGLYNYRLIKALAIHNASLAKTILVFEYASSREDKVAQLQAFLQDYPFYKESLPLVYAYPFMWSSLKSINYRDLVAFVDQQGEYRRGHIFQHISSSAQWLQHLATSADPEEQATLNAYLDRVFKEFHLDFEENMDYVHLLMHAMAPAVADVYYAHWLQDKHPTLPLHRPFTDQQKRLPQLYFWREQLAVVEATFKDDPGRQAEVFAQIDAKRQQAKMSWEDFIFTQPGSIVYFAYDYLFAQGKATLGLTGERLLGNKAALKLQDFDPRYLTPVQAQAVRELQTRAIRAVKDELFYAAYRPLALIFGADRIKIARMADPRLANFLLTYKPSR